jgi:hypothetical protein
MNGDAKPAEDWLQQVPMLGSNTDTRSELLGVTTQLLNYRGKLDGFRACAKNYQDVKAVRNQVAVPT